MNFDQIVNTVEIMNTVREEYLEESTKNIDVFQIKEDLENNPISDGFIERGDSAMITMTNLNIGEFMEIYPIVESVIQHVKRGPRPKISPKDSLFLTIVMLKNYFKWEAFSNMFGLKVSVVEKTIKIILSKISCVLNGKFIQNITKDEQDRQQINFHNFPHCIEIVDVCFQPIQKPMGSFQSKKIYFRGKHRAYGVKVEYTHAPDKRLMRDSGLYPGIVHDFRIFSENVDRHLEFLKNGDIFHGVIANLGYNGIEKFIPTAVIPKKNSILPSILEWNHKVSLYYRN